VKGKEEEKIERRKTREKKKKCRIEKQ